MSLITDKKAAIKFITERLHKIYGTKILNGKEFFINSAGVCFIVSPFPEENAVVVEYMFFNALEDGDVFYLDDYDSEDELFADILAKIEQ